MTEQERFDLMRDEIIELKHENKRLQSENKMLKTNRNHTKIIIQRLKEKILTAKTEAYKEFAVELKGEYIEVRCIDGIKRAVLTSEIDNLLKEKIGEE